jgi:hypothetical protein
MVCWNFHFVLMGNVAIVLQRCLRVIQSHFRIATGSRGLSQIRAYGAGVTCRSRCTFGDCVGDARMSDNIAIRSLRRIVEQRSLLPVLGFVTSPVYEYCVVVLYELWL